MVVVCFLGFGVVIAFFMVFVGIVIMVLFLGDIWVTFCRVGFRSGRVSSCSGFIILIIVLSFCMVVVFSIVRLDAFGWIFIVLGKVVFDEVSIV